MTSEKPQTHPTSSHMDLDATASGKKRSKDSADLADLADLSDLTDLESDSMSQPQKKRRRRHGKFCVLTISTDNLNYYLGRRKGKRNSEKVEEKKAERMHAVINARKAAETRWSKYGA